MRFSELLAVLRREVDAEAYLVGGSVRDSLLGRALSDLDLAVPASDAERVARAVAGAVEGTVVPLGERVRTWRVALPEGEVRYLDFAPMEGEVLQDLGRRDFTINAMAVPLGRDLPDGVIDPFGGQGDLRAGLVRMVRRENLAEDPARLLRGVRFVAELGFSLEPGTREAIGALAGELGRVAPERIREELCRILAAEGAVTWLELMDELGLLDLVLPELALCKGVEQPKEHHWEVFRHQMESLAAAEVMAERRVSPKLGKRPFLAEALERAPWHPALEGYFERPVGNLSRRTVLKLAALLHDVGKPRTKAVQPNGRVRFFGHSELGAEMVEEALTRLRFSEQQVRMVKTMVEEHLRPGQWSNGGLPTARALYRYFRDLGDVAMDTIFLNLADHIAARGPAMEPRRWLAHTWLAQHALDAYFTQEERAAEPRLVTGRDLMGELHIEPGRLVGELLREVDEAWKTGEIETREEALALARHRVSLML